MWSDICDRGLINIEVFNVGSGQPISILDLARALLKVYGRKKLELEVLHRARKGDVRHCFVNIGKNKSQLGLSVQGFVGRGVIEFSQMGY